MKTEKTKIKPLITIKEVAMSYGGGLVVGSGIGNLLNFMVRDWKPERTIQYRLIKSAGVLSFAAAQIVIGSILVKSAFTEVEEKQYDDATVKQKVIEILGRVKKED